MRADKRKATDFGKRGLERSEQTERVPSMLERLRKAGTRWWGARGPSKKIGTRVKGRTRQAHS